MDLWVDLQQDHLPLWTTVTHFAPQPWAADICVHALICLHHAIEHTHKQTRARSLISRCVVENRTWMFQESGEFRRDTSSTVSPQGHSLQAAAAAAAAITALHLPAPFNWLMLFDMSEQSSQLASGRLQLGPGLNAAENFAKLWYEVTARLKSIRRTWLKATVVNPMLRELLEQLRDGLMQQGFLLVADVYFSQAEYSLGYLLRTPHRLLAYSQRSDRQRRAGACDCSNMCLSRRSSQIGYCFSCTCCLNASLRARILFQDDNEIKERCCEWRGRRTISPPSRQLHFPAAGVQFSRGSSITATLHRLYLIYGQDACGYTLPQAPRIFDFFRGN